jgi:hypothetical protein
MLSPAHKKTRAVGACVPCARKKRKVKCFRIPHLNRVPEKHPAKESAVLTSLQCDQAEPRCSQCSKHDDVCEKRKFKPWFGPRRRCDASLPHKNGQIDEALFRKKAVSDSPMSSQDTREAPGSKLRSSAQRLQADNLRPAQSSSPGEQSGPWYSMPIEPEKKCVHHECHRCGRLLTSSSVNHDHLEQFVIQITSPEQCARDGEDIARINDTTDSSQPQNRSVTGFATGPTRLLAQSPILIDSALQQFLWSYYVDLVRDRIVCFEAEGFPACSDFQDPFTALIPRMVLSDRSLQASAFYLATMQWNQRHERAALHTLPELFLQRATQGLISISSHATDTQTVLIVIATAVHLYLSDSIRHRNFLELARSAAAFLADRLSSSKRSEESDYQTIMSFLRWVDISTLCSLRPPPILTKERTHRLLELGPYELGQSRMFEFDRWSCHPIYAFSIHLVNPLLKLGRLSQMLHHHIISSDGEAVGSEHKNMEEEINELEKNIIHATDKFETIQNTGSADSASQISLNRAMHCATLLLFYARLKRLPFTAALIRRYVRQIVDEVLLIRTDTRASNAVLFPLGVAGCEAVDASIRLAIEERIKLHTGLQTTYGLQKALQQIWSKRDEEPGLLWPAWQEKG